MNDPRRRFPPSRRTTGAGFTLFEVTLTLLITVMVLGGVLVLFDANSKLARSQTHLANMQQSLRVAQYLMVRNVRMTGRGPLLQRQIGNAVANHYDALAVAMRDNVGAAEYIAVLDADSPEIVEGTDVLTIRGVFTNPLYQFNPASGVFGRLKSGARSDLIAMSSRISPAE